MQPSSFVSTIRHGGDARATLGPDERAHIEARDSAYLASIGADGWPYIQHRGGPPGFLRVIDPHTIGFADLRGNRQLLSTGNVAADDRVALILIDYPQRARLKLLGHARTVVDAALADQLAPPELRTRVERVFLIDVVAFDWNCSAYITPRWTEREIAALVANR
jgi:predicted pyridoxine 5'-phosphate oxidase superfamily flavin-nucleotide-binding protein